MAKKNRKKQINRVIAPLTKPGDVMREVNADTRLKYRPVAKDIKGTINVSREQSGNYKSWYKQHNRQLKGLRRAGDRSTAATAAQAAAQSRQAGDQDAANRREMQGDENASAAYRGVTPDSTAASRGVEAEAQRSNLRGISAAQASQQGQANSNLLGQIQGAARLGRDAALRGERSVRQEAKMDMRALKADRGAFRVQRKGEIRQSERDWHLQNKTLAGKSDYNDAIQNVAALGLAGKQASANATMGSARLYSGAKIKSAKIYGRGQNGKDIKGTDLKRAGSYLRETVGDAHWTTVKQRPGAMVDKLVNRGVDPKAARMTVRRYLTVQAKNDAKNKPPGGPAWDKEKKQRSGRR